MEDIRRGLCPLCGHHEIVQAWPTYPGDDGNDLPLAEAHSKRSWTGGITMYGPMSTFTCLQCGFTQWFAAAPENIPIGGEFNTALLLGRK